MLAALRTGDMTAPRVVVLEGHSGTGKSRIIRELYSRLQADQPTPGYWPELPEATRSSSGPGTDPFADRKNLGPSLNGFVWPAGALPTFLWWAFNCDRMPHGDLLDVLAQANPELHAHLIPASLAWRDAAGWGDRIKASREQVTDLAREALTESGVDAAAAVLDSFSVAVPVLGLWVSWLTKGAQAVKHRRDQRRMVATDVDLHEHASGARSSAAEEIAGLLLASTHVDVPSVVVIEDLHLMGPELGELIDRLTVPRADKPLLVIATAWPEGRSNQSYAQWRTRAAERGSLRLLAMPDLDVDSRVEMLRRAAPNTTDADATKIVTRYQNPLALQMLLSLKRIQVRIGRSAGALALNDSELSELPSDIKDLYRQRWRELPDAVREALMITAGGLPAETGPGAWSFLRDIVADAGGRSGLLSNTTTADALAKSLEEAEDPYYWNVSRGGADATVTAFREAVLADIAILDLRENYDQEDIEALQAATITELSEWIDRERAGGYLLDSSDERALVAARWLWELTTSSSQPTIAVSVAGLAVARAQADTFQFGEAITTLTARPWTAPLPSEHPDVLAARGNLASWLRTAGRVGEAVEQLQALLVDSVRVLGADHPDTLTTRDNLALSLGASGRVGEAAEQLQALLADSVRVLGADHPDTLTTRNNLAGWLGEAGRVDEAVEQLQALLVDSVRVLGADHPNTLTARSNLATKLHAAGRVGEAIQQSQALLADRLRVLGADHPDTLTTRNNLAMSLGEAGRVDEAVEQFQALLAVSLRVLGSDHPNTLSTRGNLAVWLGEAGRVDEAVEQLQALLVDSLRVLGTDHPNALTVRSNLAHWLGRSGRVDEAVEQFQALLVDRIRILGADHPNTLTTRNNLALSLGEAGRVDAAVEQFEALLVDRIRILGSDHPDTLTTRSSLAKGLGEAGSVDAAVEQLQALFVDCLRVLGADNPNTLTTRNNLAYWLGQSSRVDEAVEQFQALLADSTRILGSDHPNTLRARHNLAFWLVEVGRVGEAVEQSEALLADSIRVLGADHPDTVRTQTNLSFWLGQSGTIDGSGDGIG